MNICQYCKNTGQIAAFPGVVGWVGALNTVCSYDEAVVIVNKMVDRAVSLGFIVSTGQGRAKANQTGSFILNIKSSLAPVTCPVPHITQENTNA